MTPIILISLVTSVLAIVAATVALVVGRPDRQAQSEIHILREEQSKLWDCLQGEIRRQAVRTSRSGSRSALPLADSVPLSGNGSVSDRSSMLAEFERRIRGGA